MKSYKNKIKELRNKCDEWRDGSLLPLLRKE